MNTRKRQKTERSTSGHDATSHGEPASAPDGGNPTGADTLHRHAAGTDRPDPPSRDIPLMLLVMAAVALTIFAALAVWEVDRQRNEARFAEQAGHLFPELLQSIREHLLLTMQIGHLMSSANTNRITLFEQLADEALARTRDLALVAWVQPGNSPVPVSGAMDRQFQLTAVRSAGTPASELSTDPDSFSNRNHDAAMRRAIQTGRTAVSDGLILFTDGDDHRPGIVFFQPVYTNPERDFLDGVVKVGVRVDEMIGNQLAGKGLAAYVFDVTDSEQLLLFAGADSRPRARAIAATPEDLARRMHQRYLINVADRRWSVWFIEGNPAGTHLSLRGWLTLLGGGTFTLALAVLGVRQRRQLRQSHARLANRSRQLTDALRRAGQLEAGSKKLYEVAEEADERLRLLSDYAGDMISQHAPNGQIHYVSTACRGMLGYSPEEICRLPPYALIDPDYLDQILHEEKSRLPKEDSFTANYPLVHREGHTVWVESSHRVRRDENGKAVEILIISRDITHRRLASLALRESELLYRSVFEHAAVGMALFDPIEGHCLKVNQALCAMLGYTRSELVEMNYRDLTHPADLNITPRHARQLLLGQLDTFRIEKRYLRKNGDVLWVLVNAALIRDRDGKPTHLAAQIQDISDRKLAEQALDRLRKPLAELAPVTGPATDEMLPQIGRVREQLQTVADRLEALAHSEHPADISKSVDLGKTIRKAAVHLASLHADLTVPVTVGDMPRVGGDSQQLERLFRHLMYCLLTCCRQPEQITVSAQTTDAGWEIRLTTVQGCIDTGMLESLLTTEPVTRPADLQMAVSLCHRIACSHGGGIRRLAEGGIAVSLPSLP
ncbi:MAG: PAS domain S-box protein [Aquisalimonadaceae bacterium]